MKLPSKIARTSLAGGFSLLETTIAITILGVISVLLASMLGTASNNWIKGEEIVDSYQNGRTALELMTREISAATIDTCQQFTIMTGETLASCGCEHIDPKSQAALFVAPLGKDGNIRAVGYYLQRDQDRQFYRLKRLYVGPENEDYYRGGFDSYSNDPNPWTSASQAGVLLGGLDAAAFDDSDPDNPKSIVAPVAEGVLAMWMQCFDVVGNPIPWLSLDPNHPKSELIFNSAALFQMATTQPFDDGTSFRYFPASDNAVKGNRLPAAVEITLVTVDLPTLDRTSGFGELPTMTNVITSDNTLDVEASLRQLLDELDRFGIDNARTFTSRVKLANAN